MNTLRAREWMQRCGIDAMIATSPVNITYFSGYHIWLDTLFKQYMIRPGGPSAREPSYAVVAQDGSSALVVDQDMSVNAAEVSAERLYVYGKRTSVDSTLQDPAIERDSELDRSYRLAARCLPTATESLIEALREMGLSDAKLGVEMEGLPEDQCATIRAGLPRAQLKDCTNLIRLIRMVKTPDEIDTLRRAAQIAEDAGVEALKLGISGANIQDIVGRFRALVANEGADFEHFCYTIGGYGLATEPNYRLTSNDILQVDWGCIYRHYFSDTGTTLMTKTPTKGMLRYFEAARQSIEDAQQKMRPGVKSSHVQSAMTDALATYGIEEQFPHGHGMGLEVRDYPILVPDNGLHIQDECIDVPSDLPLEKDMVVNLESSVVLPGYGGWHSEQTFLINDNGASILIPQARDAPIVCHD